MAHDVFVSHSSKDKVVADAIVATLEKNNIRCWVAPRDIKPGYDWGQAITDAIEGSRIFLIVFSGNANRSQRVLDEVNFAISEEIPILPFRIENLEPQGAMKLHLSSRHWLDAYDPSWEAHLKKLITIVAGILETKLEEDNIERPLHITKAQQHPRINLRWLLVGILVIILIASGVFFSSEIMGFMTSIYKGLSSTGIASLDPLPFTETEEPEPLNQQEHFSSKIYAYLEETPPTFEDDFSSAKSEWGLINTPDGSWPIEEFIDNNSIHLKHGPIESGDIMGSSASNLISNDLFTAVDFAISVKGTPEDTFRDPSYGTLPSLIFNASEDLSEYSELTITQGVSQGKINIIDYNKNGNSILESVNHKYAYQWKEYIFMIYEDSLAVSLNNEIKIYIKRPEIKGDKNYLRFSEGNAPVERVQFWNLDKKFLPSEEFISLAQSTIETQEPTLSDNFSAPNAKWGDLRSGDSTLPAEDFIRDGVLSLTANNEIIKFPESRLIESKNFALDFDFDPISYREKGGATKLSFLFRAATDTSSYYAIDFYPADDIWQVTQFADNSSQVLDQGSYEGAIRHRVRLCVFDKQTAILLDEDLIYYSDSILNKYKNNLFYLQGEDNWQTNLGYLSFWNLEGVDFE